MAHPAPVITAALLLAAFCMVLWVARAGTNDLKKLQGEEPKRPLEDRYKRWARSSFLIHFGGGIAILALIGRLPAIFSLPPEFNSEKYTGFLRATPASAGLFGLSDIAVSLLGGLLGGIIFITAVMFVRQRRMPPGSKNALLGNTDQLMPRTPAQRRWWLVVAANAGVSEELYYRLVFPLLLYFLIPDILVCFSLAAIVFGLGHFYQGVAGIVGTMLVALIFSVVYLVTGSLILAMALHFLIDARVILFTTLQKNPGSPLQTDTKAI